MSVLVPISGQSFSCQQDWINRASRVLTGHPEYLNTENHGPAKGWRGYHFTAMCFDQKGRRCRNGGDFQCAEDDGSYPIWWIWPDQIAATVIEQQRIIAQLSEDASRAAGLALEVERLKEDRAIMAAALDDVETGAGISTNGNVWRFWQGKLAEHYERRAAARAVLDAKP